MKYTLFHEETGIIIQSGENPNPTWYCSEPYHRLLLDVEGNSETQMVVEGALVDILSMLAAKLEVERSMALARIDRDAENVRGLFVTNTPSQSAVYMAKEAEAVAFMANQDIAPGLTPNLTREASRLGETRFNCAWVILAMAEAWREISAEIEDRRLVAKAAARLATDEESLQAAITIDWSDIQAQA